MAMLAASIAAIAKTRLLALILFPPSYYWEKEGRGAPFFTDEVSHNNIMS